MKKYSKVKDAVDHLRENKVEVKVTRRRDKLTDKDVVTKTIKNEDNIGIRLWGAVDYLAVHGYKVVRELR
jgi:hypothetical protein